MPGYAKVLADSVSPAGVRLTTFELKFPRFLLAQFNTHRQLSRNARSSRAVPTAKLIEEIRNDPVVPVFRANLKGMVAGDKLDELDQEEATHTWLAACDYAIDRAADLLGRNVAKETVNRLLEPYMWAYVVASATEWRNFFALRTAPDAQPEFRDLAGQMLAAMQASVPVERTPGVNAWHLPYVIDAERKQHGSMSICEWLSVARCARVSYAPFDGNAAIDAELDRSSALALAGHWSPFEHQGIACETNCKSGNFQGWRQLRKLYSGECRTFAIGGAA